MNRGVTELVRPVPGFRHQAFLYAGDEEFLSGTLDFIEAGVDAGDAILVAVGTEKIDALQTRLGRAAAAVQFTDMAALGLNPARIIPAWREFMDSGPAKGGAHRGVAEPIWRRLSASELVECQHHETLLNVAFDDGPPWWLMCPYDTDALDAATVGEARRSHSLLLVGGHHLEGDPLPDQQALASRYLDTPLPDPPEVTAALAYSDANLRDVREYVAAHAIASGMETARAFDLLVAATEVATNSVLHGGGNGVLRAWHDQESVVCEFSDHGVVTNPLAGRTKPDVFGEGRRGLWIANQLCDLVQLRVYDGGTVIRLHMRVGAPPADRPAIAG